MGANTLLNYYEILQCNKTASAEELKKNYQRLLLSSHPDKSGTSEENFLQIQEAWSVLRDPETRKKYDATLTCHEHSEYLLYDSIKLSEMVFSESKNVYTYSCRCGGEYLLSGNDFVFDREVLGCDECSFAIEVNK